MGVSGVGKSTVAQGIATVTGWPFAEGDTFHTPANVEKMHSGHPLTDEERLPWLRNIGAWMSEQIAHGSSGVVTCSALRRGYRDVLREGRPEVRFCHLAASEDLVADRLSRRTDHFMPATLLRSQYETLEPLEPDEPGVVVSIEGSSAAVLARALEALGLAPEQPHDQ